MIFVLDTTGAMFVDNSVSTHLYEVYFTIHVKKQLPQFCSKARAFWRGSYIISISETMWPPDDGLQIFQGRTCEERI